jgi:hypothetical protein
MHKVVAHHDDLLQAVLKREDSQEEDWLDENFFLVMGSALAFFAIVSLFLCHKIGWKRMTASEAIEEANRK